MAEVYRECLLTKLVRLNKTVTGKSQCQILGLAVLGQEGGQHCVIKRLLNNWKKKERKRNNWRPEGLVSVRHAIILSESSSSRPVVATGTTTRARNCPIIVIIVKKYERCLDVFIRFHLIWEFRKCMPVVLVAVRSRNGEEQKITR